MWSIQNDLSKYVVPGVNYNILNIVVNTEPAPGNGMTQSYYNILNIVVNTEHGEGFGIGLTDYNILNIVVNTEPYIT